MRTITESFLEHFFIQGTPLFLTLQVSLYLDLFQSCGKYLFSLSVTLYMLLPRAKTYNGVLGFVLISSTGAKLNCSPNLYFAQFEPPFE
jgi:hypothetical protein